MERVYQSREGEETSTVHIFERGAWVETTSPVDRAAETYLQAPDRSREKAEALRRYRALRRGNPLYVKTPTL